MGWVNYCLYYEKKQNGYHVVVLYFMIITSLSYRDKSTQRFLYFPSAQESPYLSANSDSFMCGFTLKFEVKQGTHGLPVTDRLAEVSDKASGKSSTRPAALCV